LVEEKAPPRTMKVVDRRRFTSEGDPREDVPRESVPSPDVGPQPRQASASPQQAHTDHEASVGDGGANVSDDAQTSPSRPAPSTSPEFVELIASLAQQAEILLTGAEGLPAEPDQARRIIDYLGVLESKTVGNLSREEQQILSSVIFQLRALFVQGR
jgi:hypothetical protein